ncbi:ML domain [Mactra antiquata]
MTVTFSFYILLTVSVTAIVGLPNFYQNNARKIESFVHEFEIPDSKPKTDDQFNQPPVTLKEFSWKDCSKPGSIVNIKSLSISPDPLSFPGPFDVATQFILKQSLNASLNTALKVEKRIFGTYIDIPCVDNIGSCDYPDLCAMLAPIKSKCPDPLKKIGIDCQCPVNEGVYSLPKTEFDIAASIIPTGDYRIQASITMNKEPVVCLQLAITVV